MREVNEERVRDFFDGDILRAYAFAVRYGNREISISARQARSFMVCFLSSCGFSPAQIRNMIDVKSYLSTKTEMHMSPFFRNGALALGSIEKIFNKADEFSAIPIRVQKRDIERMIIRTLHMSGWNNKQIRSATGFHLRRIQRVIKKYEESL